MGFTVDTAVTVNGDVTKYAFEQQITNLLRGETYTALHLGAVNTLIAEFLRPRGFNTTAKLAAISNADDFKPALTYWVLSRIFAGQAAAAASAGAREQASGKAEYYLAQHHASLSRVVIDPGDLTTVARRRLPVGVNIDSGSMLGPLGSTTRRPSQIASGEIAGYDDLMLEGKL